VKQCAVAQTHLVKLAMPSLLNDILGKGCPHEFALLFRKVSSAGFDGLPRAIECGPPDPAAVGDAARYIKTLRDSGQLAGPGGRQPASGLTHQIERDEQDRQVLRRKRFSIS
jgi:hypothetical protein